MEVGLSEEMEEMAAGQSERERGKDVGGRVLLRANRGGRLLDVVEDEEQDIVREDAKIC